MSTLGSGIFSTMIEKFAHLVKPGAGVAGAINNLRVDVKKALSPLAAMVVQEYVNPVAAATAGLKVATATVAAPVTVLASGLLAPGLAALLAEPRNVTFTTAGVTASDAPATALVTGTDIDGNPLTETVTLSQTAATAAGVKCFRTVTSITYPAADGTGATIAIGFGAVFGLKKKAKSRAGLAFLMKEVVNGAVVTTGTMVSASGSAPYGSYAPATAPDGTKSYAIFYEYDATTEKDG